MPYLNVRISGEANTNPAEKLVSILMRHTSKILGKKTEVTSIIFEYISKESWFVGGDSVKDQDAVTFYLDIKVTEGTNTKDEKAAYVKAVFKDFEAVLGAITPASYIVIHELHADAWGFQGQTQEYRYVKAKSL